LPALTPVSRIVELWSHAPVRSDRRQGEYCLQDGASEPAPNRTENGGACMRLGMEWTA
jgi:hypothetical protein